MKPGLRIGTLAIVFLGAFVVLTLRLWNLQLTAADTYQELAAENQIKIVQTPAPRGEIVDRNGRLLAGTRPALSVVVDRSLIPVEAEEDLIQRLSAFLNVPAAELREQFDDAGSGARFSVAGEVPEAQTLFLVERREQFPGVSVEPDPVRVYPQGVVGGQFVGYIGRPTEADLELADIDPTDTIGKAGVEREYDSYLQGSPGFIKYRIDANGSVLGLLGEQEPSPGGTVHLSVDVDVQAQLEQSLTEGLQLARDSYDRDCVPSPEDPKCPIRAVGVVMDVTDGSILGMASVPGYDPSIFVDGLSEAEWQQLLNTAVFNNFAIQGVYAPASTFKTIAYVMALEEGIFPADVQSDAGAYFCDGLLEFRFQDGSPQLYRDWLSDGHGPVDLHSALQTSCDLYFWEVALRVWAGRGDQYDEALLQEWARDFGFGSRTGIDLPFEQRGLIPDRQWFEEQQAEGSGRVRAEGGWSGGDLMNTVIGQGDVLVTPLQLASAYAAMVNGGTLWQPHVVDRVTDADGNVLFEASAEPINEVELSERTVDLIRQDLQGVVNGPAGTARSAFVDFGPLQPLVGGKTGTAEVIKSNVVAEQVDTAWFVGVAPINDPQYVVAVVVERGGSGGRVAAPTARQVLQFLLQGPEAVTPIAAGEEAD